MEHIQIILYIIIGVIYLLSRAFKGAADATAANKPKPKDDTPSLEDMFKEIGKAVREARQPPAQTHPKANTKKPELMQPGPRQRQQSQPRQKPVQPVEKKPEKTATEWVPIYERLEQNAASSELAPTPDQLAAQFERTPVYTNEAAEVDYEDPKRAQYAGLDDRKKRFEPFDKKQGAKNAYAQLLSNPRSARQAFVLGEIFRRKYE